MSPRCWINETEKKTEVFSEVFNGLTLAMRDVTEIPRGVVVHSVTPGAGLPVWIPAVVLCGRHAPIREQSISEIVVAVDVKKQKTINSEEHMRRIC